MSYQRRNPGVRHPKKEREVILREYWEFYRKESEVDPSVLNRKLPREVFADLLDEVGTLLVERATKLSSQPGPVRQFLDENPIPPSLESQLPDDFRVFCLALNALKQWVASEQTATDRFFLGGRARQECRAVSDVCLVTGEPFAGKVQLHHLVRDGRPPLPLSTKGHSKLEKQEPRQNDDL